MANPAEKESTASQPGPGVSAPAPAPASPVPTVPATLAERLVDALRKTVTAGSAKPAEGTITTDEKSRYLAELAAYKCLNKQADAISEQINALKLQHARIRIVDSLDVVGDDLLLQQMLAELDSWQHMFADQSETVQTLLPHPQGAPAKVMAVAGVAAGASLAANLLNVVPGILGLFRTDLDLKGQTVATPSRTALQMRVARGIHTATVLLPQLRQVTDCTLLQSLLETESKRREFSRILEQLKRDVIQPLDKQIAEFALQISKLKPDDSEGKARLEGELNRAKSELQTPQRELEAGKTLLKEHDEFRKQANTAAEGGKPSLIQRACWRSVLIDSGITHLLYVEPVSMGGTEVIAKSICNLGAPSLHYLGGCVATYVLTTSDGQVVAADTRVATSQLDFQIKHGTRIRRLV